MTKTLLDEEVTTKTSVPMIRHLILRNQDPKTGEYTDWKDETLCGKLWDRIVPFPEGSICDECTKEWERIIKEWKRIIRSRE